MSFLGGLLPGFGDKKSNNTTTQTDGRSVTDYSGATVGSTINIYGADPSLMRQFFANNQSASPFTSNADANGVRTEGLLGGAGGLASMLPLLIGGALVVVALMRK